MTPRSKDLYQGIKNYVSFAQKWFKDQIRVRPKLLFFADKEDLLATINGELEKSPAYQECVDKLLQNRVVADHIGVGVGLAGESWQLTTAWHVMRGLLYAVRFQGPWTMDARPFDEQYEEFESSFYESEIHCEAIGPIDGLTIGKKITLSESLEVDQITDDEKEVGARYRLFNREYSGASGPLSVVRAKYTLPKFVGSVEGYYALGVENVRHTRNSMSTAEDCIDGVLSALRGFKAGGLSLGGIVHRRHTWLYKGLARDRHTPRLISHRPSGYFLKAPSEIEAFTSFWNSLQHPGISQRKFLCLALQRLGFASERYRDEDKIIDLLIAAEALFLNGIGNESYRGELTYRLSLRAGVFLGNDPKDRKEISEHMRKAYAVRSAIVHGSSSLSLPTNSEGQQLKLKEFVQITESHIRSALHKFIRMASDAQSLHRFDWENLLFGVTNE